MSQWVLFLWLSTNPAVLVPVEFFNSRAECLSARRAEVTANLAAGYGGGATYVCLENK